MRHGRATPAGTNDIKVLSAIDAPCLTEISQLRTTGRNLVNDFASEYAKRARAKAARAETSWHNKMLDLSESIVVEHSAELINRRSQLASASNGDPQDFRWLQEVESFIDEVIEKSGGHVRCCPERLRAVRWMIAGATAQFTPAQASISPDGAVADAA